MFLVEAIKADLLEWRLYAAHLEHLGCNNLNYSHRTHVVTCLATMSSLMRTKSTRWSVAMPNALWMLCKSAATSGRVEDSIQRWLQRRTDTTRSHDQPAAAPDVCHAWAVWRPSRTVCVESLKFPDFKSCLHTHRASWASCIRGSWDTAPPILPPPSG